MPIALVLVFVGTLARPTFVNAQFDASTHTASADNLGCTPGFCPKGRFFQSLCVNSGGTDGCESSISAAVAEISLTDVVITVAPGTYFDNVLINASADPVPVGLAKKLLNLTIASSSTAAATIINGDGAGPVFTIGPNATVELDSLTITNGVGGPVQAGTGGGGILANDDSLQINSCIISDNQAESGAGIYTNNSDLDVENSSIINNVGQGDDSEGAGISFESSEGHKIKIVSSIIDGNSAAGGGGVAISGGFEVRSEAKIIESTISNNVASGDYGGGAGLAVGGARLTMLNDTISGNSATGNPSFGGGIQAGLSNVYCDNVTIANNSAATGSGGIDANIVDLIIIIGPGRVHDHKPKDQHFVIANSIIGDNDAPGPDCQTGLDQRPIESAGYNVVGDSCFPSGQDDTNIYSDPLLGPLQDNGGTTDTQALLPGSPAI